ncbi:MAG TPA: enoyl-CoA hydratase/isomerase family protein, partial [Dehalococcoidia bacterium]
MPRNETVLWERNGNVGYLTLNRPEKLNAISPAMLREFDEVLDEAQRDDAVRVLVIRGAGRAFSAGYDLSPDAEGRQQRGDPVDDANRLRWTLERWLRLWDFPKPVIAQVHGFCLAGATQLCVMTDITIVAEDARIGLPSIPVGGGFITPMWTWLVGPKR